MSFNYLYIEKTTLNANIATIRLLTITSRPCVWRTGLRLGKLHRKQEKRKGDIDKASIKLPQKNPILNSIGSKT